MLTIFTGANSNQLYHLCTDALFEIKLVGMFENSVLCCCIYEPLNAIVCFSATISDSIDSPSDHAVEIFDLRSKSFSKIIQKPSATSSISDLVRHRHIFGCFSLLSFPL